MDRVMNLPNQLTLLRIALTPVFIILLFYPSGQARIASFIVFLLAALTDWYDGYTARKYGHISNWGKFLDPLADKILVLSAFICFWLLDYFPLWMLLIMIIRDVLITVMRSYSIIYQASMITRPYGKLKTFFQMFSIFLLFLYHLFTRGKTNVDWHGFRVIADHDLIYIMMFIVTAVTALTGLFYIMENRYSLQKIGQQLFRRIS
jgi:CDP-diacylglycerol--glycerol-3-phosphate 3-phosphatidyltransferase